MKISNSKKELAKIISENGGWREGAKMAAQQKIVMSVEFWATPGKLSRVRGEWIGRGHMGDRAKFLCDKMMPNHHQTTLSRDEYFFLYQEQGLEDDLNEDCQDADGWIEWKGGECPVGEDDLIDVKFSDGDALFGVDSSWDWGEDVDGCNIIAYRPHNLEQAKPEFCESVTRSIPEPEVKPTIEQLASDYRNRKDYADRKQQEADAAKADAEAKLAELVAAGKAIGLVLSVAGAEPELVITDWRDLQVGDVIKCVGDSWSYRFQDSEAVVEGLEGHDYEYDLRIHASIGDRTDWGEHFTFIRRP